MARVISVNEVECGSSVTEKEFESFMLDKFIPLYEQVPGQKLSLFKGERGERAGKYMVIMEFDSKETRDQIYPRANAGSEELMRILKSAGSFLKERDAMIASRIFTDYEQLDQQ